MLLMATPPSLLPWITSTSDTIALGLPEKQHEVSHAAYKGRAKVPRLLRPCDLPLICQVLM